MLATKYVSGTTVVKMSPHVRGPERIAINKLLMDEDLLKTLLSLDLGSCPSAVVNIETESGERPCNLSPPMLTNPPFSNSTRLNYNFLEALMVLTPDCWHLYWRGTPMGLRSPEVKSMDVGDQEETLYRFSWPLKKSPLWGREPDPTPSSPMIFLPCTQSSSPYLGEDDLYLGTD